MKWDLLVRLLGNPDHRGDRPAGYDQWLPVSGAPTRVEYALWDCNRALGAVRDGGRALDGLDAKGSFEEVVMLRGSLATLFSVGCCLVRNSSSDAGEWDLLNACARHGDQLSSSND